MIGSSGVKFTHSPTRSKDLCLRFHKARLRIKEGAKHKKDNNITLTLYASKSLGRGCPSHPRHPPPEMILPRKSPKKLTEGQCCSFRTFSCLPIRSFSSSRPSQELPAPHCPIEGKRPMSTAARDAFLHQARCYRAYTWTELGELIGRHILGCR